MTKAKASGPLLIILCLFVLAGALAANFELRSLTVAFTLNPDGSAHATETSRLFINSSQSISLYESSVVYNDLASWIDRTNISDLRAHVSQAGADLENIRVRPGPVESCDIAANICYTTFVLDYDIYPLAANGTGLLAEDQYKPRTTRYQFISDGLTFPRSNSGDIILPYQWTLQINVPQAATRLAFSRTPDELANDTQFIYDASTGQTYYVGAVRQFSWTAQTLSKFTLSYEIEEPLDTEIVGFFDGLQTQVFTTAFSWDGLAYIITVGAILLGIVWLNSINKK